MINVVTIVYSFIVLIGTFICTLFTKTNSPEMGVIAIAVAFAVDLVLYHNTESLCNLYASDEASVQISVIYLIFSFLLFLVGIGTLKMYTYNPLYKRFFFTITFPAGFLKIISSMWGAVEKWKKA